MQQTASNAYEPFPNVHHFAVMDTVYMAIVRHTTSMNSVQARASGVGVMAILPECKLCCCNLTLSLLHPQTDAGGSAVTICNQATRLVVPDYLCQINQGILK